MISGRACALAFTAFAALSLAASPALLAQGTAPAVALGNVNVGSSTSGTVTFTFGTTSVTIGSIAVVTQGAANLDFTLNSSTPGTCAAGTYTSTTCTVGVSFAPTAAGIRYGAANLLDGSGNILASGIVTGVGVAPMPVFPLGTASVVSTIFSSPNFLSVDSAGNVYQPSQNHIVYKVTPAGVVSTFYNGGSGTYVGTAVDPAGNVYVADKSLSHVDKLSSTGALLATWPSSGVGVSQPNGMAFDNNGNLYVADPANSRIVVMTPAGVGSVLTVTGYTFQAYAVAVDANNTVYISDYANNRIIEVTSGGAASVLTVTGTAIAGPQGLAVDAAGNIYLSETTSTILHITPSGVSTNITPTLSPAISYPVGAALDGHGLLYISDQNGSSLDKINLLSEIFTVSGLTAAGSTSAAQTATLENDGNATATVTSVSVSGAAAKGPSNTCAATTYASDATCVASIEFAPTTHGASPQTGTLAIAGTRFTAAVESISGDVTGDPTQLVFTPAPPTPLVAGQNAGTITVTLEDSTGATAVSGNTLPVTLTVTYATGAMVVYGPTNAVNGVVTFNTSGAALTVSGTYTYKATSTGLTSATATETVNGGPASQLKLVPALSPTYITAADTMTVTALDQYGNLAQTPANTDTIALTTTDANATLPGNFALSNSSGSAPITFNAAGNFTVTATDKSNSAVTAATINITIEPVPGYIVTSSLDDGNGACTDQTATGATLDSQCELRGAITAVNAVGDTGTTAAQPSVSFASSLYGSTISLSQGSISVSANLDLIGPGPANTITIKATTGNANFYGSTAAASVTVSGLTFTGNAFGYQTAAAQTLNLVNDIFSNIVVTGASSYGSALSFPDSPAVTINGCTFANNQSTVSAEGGAIYQSGGTLSILNSAFTSNKSASPSYAAYGGAIFQINGTLSIVNSTFTGNSSAGTIGASFGGAISQLSGTTLSILNSTFTGNSTASTSTFAYGGAIYTTAGTTTISDSLFSNNSTSGGTISYGGAIYQYGAATITGSTFTGNVVTGTSTASAHAGGAIYSTVYAVNLYNDTITGNLATNSGNTNSTLNRAGGYYKNSGAVTAYNTVISGNSVVSASSGTYVDEYGLIVTAGNGNYIDTGTSYTCTTNCTPMLSTLGNYGGTTQTMLPMPGSPLLAGGVISGDNSATTDGRGTGYSRTTAYKGASYIDTGAAEANYTLGFVQQPTNTVVSQPITPAPSVQLYESGVAVAPNKISTTPTLTAGQTTANFPATGTGGPLAITASEGTLAGTTTENTSTTNTNPGIATFSGLSINTLETDDTLTATVQNSAGTVLASTTSEFFDIIDGNAATLNYIAPPDPAVATGNTACNTTVGATGSCTVTVGLYAAGKTTVDTTSSATVILTVSATGYTTQVYTANAVNGVATFNLGAAALSPSGTYTYSATAPTYTTDTASVTEIVGAPGSTIARFMVAGVPSTVPAGVSYSFTVTAINSSGTTDTTFTGPVFLTSSDPAAVFLPQNYTFNTSDNGVHTFNVTFNTGGLQSITATTNGGQSGSETNIRVVVSYIWLLNTTGTVDKLNDAGASLTGAVGTSATASTLGGIAFDSTGNVWSVTNANNALDFNNKTGTASATYSGGGLSAPISLMVDGNGYIWIANSGNASVSVFSSTGAAVSGTSGFGASTTTEPIGASPSGLAIDNTGGVWVTSKTGNSVTHIVGAAAPVTTPTAAAVANTSVGVKP